jgi:hypothetical protein
VAIRVGNSWNPLTPFREHDGPLESAFECEGGHHSGRRGWRVERVARHRRHREYNVTVEGGAAR